MLMNPVLLYPARCAELLAHTAVAVDMVAVQLKNQKPYLPRGCWLNGRLHKCTVAFLPVPSVDFPHFPFCISRPLSNIAKRRKKEICSEMLIPPVPHPH